eukprot:3051614-Rhodomonas_salina.1
MRVCPPAAVANAASAPSLCECLPGNDWARLSSCPNRDVAVAIVGCPDEGGHGVLTQTTSTIPRVE